MSTTTAEASSTPPQYKYVGLALAVGSGLFIGSSFVFKKKGLLSAQRKYATVAGESHAYLKSPLWWCGMIIMVVGEVLNFVAYMFADAVLVTPMGALSVVICAVLSAIFLKEFLTVFGKIGCFLCVVGSVIIAINAPEQKFGGDIHQYEKLFIAPGFLTWLCVCVVVSLFLALVVARKYGKKNMLVYITVCSVIGGLSVSVTSGLGSAILLSIRGNNQFKYWFTYFLLVFVIVTLLVEINYLNKALELFNTAAVTPTYYVLFTAATLITSIILAQGMHATPIAIVTVVFGFLTICAGIALLQMSKMDPDELQQQPGFDRKSSILIRAAQEHAQEPTDLEHEIAHIEDPGVDTIRGGMGIVGSIMRARSSRRVTSRNSNRGGYRMDERRPNEHRIDSCIPRYELYDRPVCYSPPGNSNDRHIGFAPEALEPHGHHGNGEMHSTPRVASPAAAHAGSPIGLVPILESHLDRQPQLRPSYESELNDDIKQPESHDASVASLGDGIGGQSMIELLNDNPSSYYTTEPEDFGKALYSPTGIVDHYYDDEVDGAGADPLARRPTKSLSADSYGRRGLLGRGNTFGKVMQRLRHTSQEHVAQNQEDPEARGPTSAPIERSDNDLR
ncbi:hypothetical protein MCUN1_003383 [Malassezia cuniculi]|uniref:Magnesium transporter NIPA2 n=1 Tax=Malassezia cuniculi TaxID=948313 RepID=A0AAF0F1B3_9BASI|nr:hypothetical protein MCUN1_003383 [Malassezia cuniculi]